jgi:hypothetical protein
MDGESVLIASGTTILYDLNDMTMNDLRRYASLQVNGRLTFLSSQSSGITVGYGNITVTDNGVMEIGTKDSPIKPGVMVTIRLLAGPGDDQRPFIAVGGRLEIHGAPVRYVFTHLSQSTAEGSQTIVVDDNVDWKVGDHIVIASTATDPSESEDAFVSSVDGKKIGLASPLKYAHSGADPTKAEVGLLSRNVVITTHEQSPSDSHGVGVMYMPGASGSISYAEFSNLGVKGVLGDYPLHFHHVKDGMRGTIIEGLSIWGSQNRFLTIHDTNGITVRNCIGFDAIGHGFFLEGGDETENVFAHNLGILVRAGTVRASDRTPAVFWTPNPYNTWVDNVAVSSEGDGFGFLIAQDERMPMTDPDPLTLPILKFERNVAHSNLDAGIMTYPLNENYGTQASELNQVVSWANGYYGLSLTANFLRVAKAQVFANGYADMLVTGDNVTVEDTTLLGSTVGPTAQTTFGIILDGSNFTLQRSTLAGHTSSGSLTGADFIVQSSTRTLITAKIDDTTMRSLRTIIFAYPPDEQSVIRVSNYNLKGVSFELKRIDLNLGSDWTVDQFFIALKRKIP